MKTEIIVFKNAANGQADFMEYNPKKSHNQLLAELTEICGVNATTAEMMGKIVVEADATGFGFQPARLTDAANEQAEFVDAATVEFAIVVRQAAFGIPLVIEGTTVTVDTKKISGALTLLAEDLGGRIKTAMGKH